MKLGKFYALVEYLDETRRGTARANVIVSVAYLDELLREILKNALIPEVRQKDPLDKLDFVGKANLAFRLGIIEYKIRQCLFKINEIRNRFAHEFAIKTFEHPKVKGKLIELRKLVRNMEFESMEKANGDDHFFFRLAVANLIGTLIGIEVERIEVKIRLDPELDHLGDLLKKLI